MHIERIPAYELSAEYALAWQGVIENQPRFSSPFFQPRFTQAVGEVVANVEIGVIKQDN